MNPQEQVCHNPQWWVYGRAGEGHIVIHSQREQRYRCSCATASRYRLSNDAGDDHTGCGRWRMLPNHGSLGYYQSPPPPGKMHPIAYILKD